MAALNEHCRGYRYRILYCDMAFATSCASATPLAALGVVSSWQYRERRDAVRTTWMQYPEVLCGEIFVRFVIARPATKADEQSLRAEVDGVDDVLTLDGRNIGRAFSPLQSTYAWFRYASARAPFNRAAYVGKTDDDVFIEVPDFRLHLELMRSEPKTAPERPLYYGMFFSAKYKPASLEHVAHAYDLASAGEKAINCTHSGECTDAFVHTTGALQLVSRSLASTIASDARVNESILHSYALYEAQPDAKRPPALEDVWLGFALYALLPPTVAITLVKIDRWLHYFDTANLAMRNSTMLVHFMTGKHPLMYEVAYRYARLHKAACSTTQLQCSPFNAPGCVSRPDSPWYNAQCEARRRRQASRYAAECRLVERFDEARNCTRRHMSPESLWNGWRGGLTKASQTLVNESEASLFRRGG